MKALIVCLALAVMPPLATAQPQDNPAPTRRDSHQDPPPADQDRTADAAPDARDADRSTPADDQDQGDLPPPSVQAPEAGPPPDDRGQDDGPAPDDQGDYGAPPPGDQDQPPPGDEPRDDPPPGDDDRLGQGPDRGEYDPPDGAQADARGQPAAPPGATDRPMPDSLGGWILVTTDADWQAKWETAADTTPRFTSAHDLARGQKAFILIFLANPALDASGQADVTCDIQLVRPNGSISLHQPDAACLSGHIESDTHLTYLSAPVIGFIGEPGDPAGTWTIKVTLKDNHRHIQMPLQTTFNLKR